MTSKDPFNTAGKLFSRPEERKTLHPLFGTFCLTQSFTIERGSHQERIHLEAYLDDPVRKTWSVIKVSERVEGQKVTRVKTETLKNRQDFTEAVSRLAVIENEMTINPDYRLHFPDAGQMGFFHVKAFAEREGYIFDVNHLPHARPAAGVMPPDAEFAAKDIASADAHVKRPAEEFDNQGPASKIPNTHFVFDQFTQAQRHHATLKQGMNELRVLDVLDRFVNHVEKSQAHFNAFCAGIEQRNYQPDIMDDAADALKMAEFNLKQLKVYGVDTTAFDSFILQCQVTCRILHAQGIYQLMLHNRLDIQTHQAALDRHIGEAVLLFKKIDGSEKAVKQLQDMIVQGGKLKVPPSIDIFIRNYRQQRSHYARLQNRNPAPPAP